MLAAAESGEGSSIWDRVHASVMVAQTLAAKGDAAASLERFAGASTDVVAGRKALPDDAGLRRAHAWLLDRWCDVLQAEGESADALAKGEEALVIRDAQAADDGRHPRAIQVLVDRLWELADYALEAGDAEKAAALLDRAQNEVQALFPYDDSFVEYRADLVVRRDDCLLIASGSTAADANQALRVAYLLVSMKRHPDAHTHFDVAMADPSIRDDWDEHNLYNAACNAGLAHAAADAADKSRFEEAALAWLQPHVARLRGLAASDDEESSQNAEVYLQWVREDDADLESLRALPQFKALFE